jgi:hypothetical protein
VGFLLFSPLSLFAVVVVAAVTQTHARAHNMQQEEETPPYECAARFLSSRRGTRRLASSRSLCLSLPSCLFPFCFFGVFFCEKMSSQIQHSTSIAAAAAATARLSTATSAASLWLFLHMCVCNCFLTRLDARASSAGQSAEAQNNNCCRHTTLSVLFLLGSFA